MVVGIVQEYILFLITSDDDMVKSSLKLYARFPCHPATLYSTICINASLTLCLPIKAKTNEGMGFIGRGEGIAAYAVCLLRRIE
jgi:2C-methyl-D-erythritol 2,4-cyclodiphosphate synthase